MGEFQPEAHLKGFAGCNFIALLCNKYPAIFFPLSILIMYKIFFNDRTVQLTSDSQFKAAEINGLYYKFKNIAELEDILFLFETAAKIQNLTIFHIDEKELFDHFASCFKMIEAAGGLVNNKNDEILAIKRLGKWDLPKGKLEKGENPGETAVREVREECGLNKIQLQEFFYTTYHIYRLKNKQVLKKTYWFKMLNEVTETLIPQTKENISEVKWLRMNNLNTITDNTYGSIVEVLKAASLL
jgi:ADP-ribose pyrophosphatase YjhB (NUDIX family)